MRERVLHALDLGMLGDWDGAKRSLEDLDDPIVPRLVALLTEQQRRERERMEAQALARHELGNAIAIAQANAEALVDGVLEPTSERLAGIRDALITCGVLLDDLKKQNRPRRQHHLRSVVFDVCELIASQVQLVSGIAETKNVALRYEPCRTHLKGSTEYSGDPDRVALAVRDMLLGAVRYTPPGGTIDVSCVKPAGEIELSVSASGAGAALGCPVASRLVEALGGQAQVLAQHARGTTFLLQLPSIQLAS